MSTSGGRRNARFFEPTRIRAKPFLGSFFEKNWFQIDKKHPRKTILEQSEPLEARNFVAADDDMVMNHDSQGGAGLDDGTGHLNIGL